VTAPPPTLLLGTSSRAGGCEELEGIQGPGCAKSAIAGDCERLKGVRAPACAGVGNKPVSSGMILPLQTRGCTLARPRPFVTEPAELQVAGSGT